jgi:outer membrane protein assembly factor BamB
LKNSILSQKRKERIEMNSLLNGFNLWELSTFARINSFCFFVSMLFIAGLILVFTSQVFAAPQPSKQEKQIQLKTFAVSGFPVYAPKADEISWLGVGLGDDLATRLSLCGKSLQQVERLQFNEVLRASGYEMLSEGVSDDTIPSENEKQRLRGIVQKAASHKDGHALTHGAAYVIVGSLWMDGEYGKENSRMHANVRLVNVETSEIISGVKAEGTGTHDGFVALQESLAEQLAEKMGVPEEDRIRVRRFPTESGEVYRLFAQARERLYKGDYKQAEELSSKAIDAGAMFLMRVLLDTEREAVAAMAKAEKDVEVGIQMLDKSIAEDEAREKVMRENLAYMSFNKGEKFRLKAELIKKKGGDPDLINSLYREAIHLYDAFLRETSETPIQWSLPTNGKCYDMFVRNDILYAKCGKSIDTGTLWYAVDVNTGRLLWTQPALRDHLLKDNRFIIWEGNDYLRIYNALTGNLVAESRNRTSAMAHHEPIVINNIVYLVLEKSAWDELRDDPLNFSLAAIDINTGEELWQFEEKKIKDPFLNFAIVKNDMFYDLLGHHQLDPSTSAAVSSMPDGMIFVVTDDEDGGYFYVLNLLTGDLIMKSDFIPHLSASLSSPEINDRYVTLTLSMDQTGQINSILFDIVSGKICPFDSRPKPWASKFGDEPLLTSNGLAFFDHEEELKAVDLVTGKVKWTTFLGSQKCRPTPQLQVTSDNRLLINHRLSFYLPASLKLIDINDGSMQWSWNDVWKAREKSGVIYITSKKEPKAWAFNLADQKLLTTFKAETDKDLILGIKAIGENQVCFAIESYFSKICHQLFSFDLHSGDLLWQIDAGNKRFDHFIAVEDKTFVAWENRIVGFAATSSNASKQVLDFTSHRKTNQVVVKKDQVFLGYDDKISCLNVNEEKQGASAWGGVYKAVLRKADCLHAVGETDKAFRLISRELYLNKSISVEGTKVSSIIYNSTFSPCEKLKIVDRMDRSISGLNLKTSGMLDRYPVEIRSEKWIALSPDYALGRSKSGWSIFETKTGIALLPYLTNVISNIIDERSSGRFVIQDGIAFFQHYVLPSFAVHIESGKLIWREYDYSHTGLPGPIVLNNIVYTVLEKDNKFKIDNDPQLCAYDINKQQLLWRHSIRGDLSYELRIAGNRLYYEINDHKTVVVLDLLSGDQIWAKDIEIVSENDDTLFRVSNEGYLEALLLSSGGLKWKTKLEDIRSVQSKDRAIYVLSRENTITFLDPKNGNINWQIKLDGSTCSSISLENGVLYASSQENLVALEANSGQRLWTLPGFGSLLEFYPKSSSRFFFWKNIPKRHAFSGPWVHNNIAYFITNDNHIRGVDIQKGTQIMEYNLGEKALASPEFRNGMLFIQTAKSILALNGLTGELNWYYDLINNDWEMSISSDTITIIEGNLLRSYSISGLGSSKCNAKEPLWANEEQFYAYLFWGRTGLAVRKLHDGDSLGSALKQCELSFKEFNKWVLKISHAQPFLTNGYLAVDPTDLKPVWLEEIEFSKWVNILTEIAEQEPQLNLSDLSFSSGGIIDFLNQNDTDLKQPLLKIAEAISASNEDSLLIGIHYLEKRKDALSALRCSKKMIDLDEDDPNGFLLAGYANTALSKKTDAIKCYQKVTELAPDFSNGWQCYANGLSDAGDHAQAYGVMKSRLTQLKNNQKQPTASDLLSTGWYAYLAGDLSSAQAYNKKCLQVHPNHPNVLYNQGLIYTEKGDLETAVEYYEKALTVESDQILNAAIEDLKAALKKEPHIVALNYALGMLLEAQAAHSEGMEKAKPINQAAEAYR